ncbi:hemerythrin domain-containing protein [Sphingobium lignivorans]|uniref:Hemerythrin-like domain-containing protein n=1 Tax=Sphingobium lignivorans TaxID=2735886 RepID=A0ABR6NBR4_9SPHN|nr:hemerythrin domain-containing protein [Sphingobium lignivorans]MBB5984501.1 hypothetical protein [Sphingobium lignivorans]
MTDDIFRQHRVMIAAGEDLLATARRTPPARLEEIAQLRVRLAGLAMAHLKAEEETIVRPLMGSGRIDQIPGAAALIAECRAGHGAYSDHVRRWTLPAIDADRAGYAQALSQMLDQLRAMMEREERLLYWPALRLLGAARETQAG